MSERRCANFKQIDVTRALKAAQAAGLEIGRVEIDAEGKIALITTRGEAEQINELEKWKQDRARAT